MKQRPTIDELEAILNSPDAPKVRINPDGSITTASEFQEELQHLINRHSQENASNTPDFILAQYLAGCLAAWNQAVQQRETWHGRDARPVENYTLPDPLAGKMP